MADKEKNRQPEWVEKLFAGERKTPKVFADGWQEGFRQELGVIDRAKTGYPGPRARIPISKDLKSIDLQVFAGNFYDSETSQIFNNFLAAGLERRIVFCYPTGLNHLPSYEDIAKTNPEFHREQFTRLGKASEFYAASNIERVGFLPLVKISEGSSSVFLNTPVRFWVGEKPTNNALYIFIDNGYTSGKTLAAAYSLLRDHGVEDENIKSEIEVRYLLLTDTQKAFFNELEKRDPDLFLKFNVLIDLYGIGGIEAVLAKEAEFFLEYMLETNYSKARDALNNNITRLINGLEIIMENPKKIQNGEVSDEFLAEMRKIGLLEPLQTRRSK